MNNMNDRLRTWTLLALLAVGMVFTACNKDDEDPKTEPETFTKGVLVLNEGSFGSGNATVDFIWSDSLNRRANIFQDKNGRPLGDVGQSIAFLDGKGYVVVNNSNKIEVVNPSDFASLGTITGLTSPRYAIKAGTNKAFVTDLFGGAISVVNLSTLAVENTIQTGGWSEAIASFGNNVYVSIADSNYIAVIDAATETVTSNIVVSKGPNSMAFDSFGKLWVLCDGGWQAEIPQLHRVNVSSGLVEASFAFPSLNDYPNSLQMNADGNVMFFLNNDIYRMSIGETAIPTTVFHSAGTRYLYGLGLDPATGVVYAGDAKDFTQNGTVLRISPLNGNLLDTLQAGVAPSKFYFR